MSPRARRALLVGVGLPATTLGLLVATASPAAAHQLDAGSLPAPDWLLGYLGAFAVLAAALALRSSWAAPRLDLAPATDGPDDAGPATGTDTGPRVTVGSFVALLLLAGVVIAALAGEDLQAANVAPVTVSVIWWVGLPLVCLLAGDVLRFANPFVPLVAALERVLPARAAPDRVAPPPAWTAGVLLVAFRWTYLAYYRPGSPRAVAVAVLAYTAVAVAGGWWWGRGWLATGEAFGALSRATGGLLRGRLALPARALAALSVAWLGVTAFDAVGATGFWADVLGSRRGWGRTLLDTVGLVWVTAIVAVVAAGVARAIGARTVAAPGATEAEVDDDGPRWPAWIVGLVGAAVLLLAIGWFVAHDLTLLLFEGQNFVILLSDPLGRGWDLFGTLDHDVSLDVVRAGWVRVVQLAALLAGHVGAVVVAHDAALAHVGRRRGMVATWAVAALAAASAVAAALLVLE